MPGLHIRTDGCAALETNTVGQPTGGCPRPPTVRAVWRFADGSKPLLLCDVHADEYTGHDRLTVTR